MAKGPITGHYSRGIILHKCFAPARLQSEHSSLILATNTPTGTAVLRKTRTFCSFQISQETSNINETRGRCDWVICVALCLHQALTDSKGAQSASWMSCSPNQLLSMPHTLTVNLHWKRRCAADS